jgi:nitrous oxide reductase accessory protein NosL
MTISTETVMDYETGEALPGMCSVDLAERSRAAGPEGAVHAMQDAEGVWHFVEPQDVHHYRANLRQDVRVVYVQDIAKAHGAK